MMRQLTCQVNNWGVPTDDTDADGYTDKLELTMGTDPLNALAFPLTIQDIDATTVMTFGQVGVNSIVTRTLTVSNVGTGDLVIGAISAVVSPQDFTAHGSYSLTANGCTGATLPPSGTCTVVVVFSPTTAYVGYSGLLRILSNDPDEPDYWVSLIGTAYPPQDIDVLDPIVDMGDVKRGQSASTTVTVQNLGELDLVIGNVAQANPLAAPFAISNDTCSGATLFKDQSCTLTLTYSPTATGVASDTFNIPSNDPDEATVTVTITGTGTVPDINVLDSAAATDDLTIPFGLANVGQTITHTVTVQNIGQAGLVLGQVGQVNPPPAPFGIAADTCSNTTIPPAGSCTFNVIFQPTSGGAYSGFLDIAHDDWDESPTIVNLSGSTSMPDIAVADSIAPSDDLLLPFGDVNVGSSVTQTVTVKNLGNDTLNVNGVILNAGLPVFKRLWKIISQAPTVSPFSITTDNCSMVQVVPNGSCTIMVRFAPMQTGAAGDSIQITSDDPDEPVVLLDLSGNGVIPSGPTVSIRAN